MALTRAGQRDQAVGFCADELDACERTHGPVHPDTGALVCLMANVHMEAQDEDAAFRWWRRAAGIVACLAGDEPPWAAAADRTMVRLEISRDRPFVALQTAKRALDLAEKATGPGAAELPRFLLDYAHLLVKVGRADDARPLFKRALMVHEHHFGEDHLETGRVLVEVGLAHIAGKNAQQAVPLLRRGLGILEERLGPTHPETHDARSFLTEALSSEMSRHSSAAPAGPS